MNQNELYHYGIKGMKWGVRRDLKSTGGRQKDFYKTVVKLDRSEHKIAKLNRKYLSPSSKKSKLYQLKKKYATSEIDKNTQKIEKTLSKYDGLIRARDVCKRYNDRANSIERKRYSEYERDATKRADADYKNFKNNKGSQLDKSFLRDIISMEKNTKRQRERYVGRFLERDYEHGGYEKYSKSKGWKDPYFDEGYVKARDNYTKECEKTVKDLLGKYGDRKLKGKWYTAEQEMNVYLRGKNWGWFTAT